MSDLPRAWQVSLASYDLTNVKIGQSVAGVLRLVRGDTDVLFAKYEPLNSLSERSELDDEAEKTRWLKNHGVLSAEVLDFVTEEECKWMLTKALPGHDLASHPTLSKAAIVEIVADALARLQSLNPGECPFDLSLDIRIRQAEARVNADCVNEADFDGERIGCSTADLFEDLLVKRPAHETSVVTHGDACLPNLIATDLSLSGFVDCGRLGVADRAQDIALAARSIHHNLGEKWRDDFLSRCGFSADDNLLAYYRLMDEFF